MSESEGLMLEGIEVRYGDKAAISGLTLSVARGELLALLGPSGCGKTTTLRAVAGFLQPSAGRLSIAGRDMTRVPAHRRNIGVVFQSYALFPHLTVLENVAFGLRMRHIRRAERLKKAGAALNLVGLESLSQRYPAHLSGGQQQRVALARALVIEPDILLLDEPLSNLDANLRVEMRTEIRALQQRLGITTLLVTHDQAEALSTADRVAVMADGRIVSIDTPERLCNAPTEPFTARFLGGRTVIAGTTVAGVFHAAGLSCQNAPDNARFIVLRGARLCLGGTGGPLDLTGQVVSRTYLGETFETEMETPAGRVRVIEMSNKPEPPMGTSCRIAALPGGVTFM